jgi:hypothetical protein
MQCHGGSRVQIPAARPKTPSTATPTSFPARRKRPNRAKNVNKIGSLRPLRAKIRLPLVRRPIQLRQGFAHHAELRLAVELEHLGVALAQHLRDHVIGHAAGAEPGREGMPEFVHREMRHANPLQRGGPGLPDIRSVGLPGPAPEVWVGGLATSLDDGGRSRW